MYLEILYGETPDLQLPALQNATHLAGTDYITLFEIYVLAEFLRDTVTKETLKIYLWSALFEGDYTKRTLRSVPCAEALQILYDGTPNGCIVRKIVVDTFAHTDLAGVLYNDDRWPREFTRELVLKLYKQVDWRGGKWSNTHGLLWRLKKEEYFEAA